MKLSKRFLSFLCILGLANQGFAANLTTAEQDLLFAPNATSPQVLTDSEMAETEGEFFGAGAIVGTVVYMATTPRDEWKLEDAAKAAVVGEIMATVGTAAGDSFMNGAYNSAAGTAETVTQIGAGVSAATPVYYTVTAIGGAYAANDVSTVGNAFKKNLEICARLNCTTKEIDRYEEKQLAELNAQKQRDAELAQQRQEAEMARQRREAEIARQQREAELARQRREAEMARQRREAEIARQQHEAELARQARQREMERARAAAAQARPAGRRR